MTARRVIFTAAIGGKRSISLDFSTDEGRETLIALIRDADVLIENFKVGGLAKYGLDWEAVRKLNPRLIYCSITGFGQNGPLRPSRRLRLHYSGHVPA